KERKDVTRAGRRARPILNSLSFSYLRSSAPIRGSLFLALLPFQVGQLLREFLIGLAEFRRRGAGADALRGVLGLHALDAAGGLVGERAAFAARVGEFFVRPRGAVLLPPEHLLIRLEELLVFGLGHVGLL